jgi:hypothetical protein
MPSPRRTSWLFRCTKWTCTILAGLMVVAWVGSGWYLVAWIHNNSFPRCTLTLSRGAITGRLGELPANGAYTLEDGLFGPYRNEGSMTINSQRWLWIPRYSSMTTWSAVELPARLTLPLWLPTLVFAVPAAWMWRVDVKRRRAAREGCCATCGYLRAGLGAGAACPECGAAVT